MHLVVVGRRTLPAVVLVHGDQHGQPGHVQGTQLRHQVRHHLHVDDAKGAGEVGEREGGGQWAKGASTGAWSGGMDIGRNRGLDRGLR